MNFLRFISSSSSSCDDGKALRDRTLKGGREGEEEEEEGKVRKETLNLIIKDVIFRSRRLSLSLMKLEQDEEESK